LQAGDTLFLSSLRPPAKGASLLQIEANLGEPVPVFTGPPRGQGANPASQMAAADAKPVKPAKGSKTAAAPPVATASVVPWTSLSPAALAASPPTELGATPAGSARTVPLPRARPRHIAEKPATP